jgi:hypothetical protein
MASNPYEVVLHAFSTELATALASFSKSTNGLVVKSVTIEVAPAMDVNQPPGANAPVANPGVTPPARAPAPAQQPPQRAGVQPKAPQGLKTVLNERLLKITLVLEVLRTMPPQNATQKTSHGFTQKAQ